MIVGIDASRANQVQRTGTELYAAELVKRLPALLASDTVRLYVREPLLDDLRPVGPNVEVRVLRWPPGILWSHLRLSWEMLWHRPDVLFVPANTVCLIHPKRTITTIHDVAFERFPELYRGRSVQRRLGWLRPLIHGLVRIFTLGRYGASERDYHRWSSRQALASSQLVLTVSEFSRQEIIQTLKADPAKIYVTYLGVIPAEVFAAVTREKQQEALERLHIERPFFLFLGRLETKKNIDGILKAYDDYCQATTTPLDLVLAGQPGFGWDEVAQAHRTLIRSGRVHALGWTSTEDRIILHSAAQALLYVSRYEGFGIPPLESMNAGVPVIASRAGSLPEVLGPAAYYVGSEDHPGLVQAMVNVSTDTVLRQKLIALGRQQATKFTWEKNAAATASFIRRAADLSD